MAKKIADLYAEIGLRGMGTSLTQLETMKKHLQATNARLIKIAAVAKKAFLISGAAIGVATVSAAKFSNQMAMVSTMLDTQTLPLMEEYTAAVKDMAVEFGQSTATLAKGLYDILSASVDTSQALDVLRASAIAAVGGFTDVATVADAVTTILNSYQMDVSEAVSITDKLSATVLRGTITMEELASSIGKVAATAAQSGVNLDELLAVIATTTRAGISADQAMTAVVGAIRSFLKPSEEGAKRAKELGFELSTATLRADGLVGVFKKMQGLDAADVAVLFPNIRGMKAVLASMQDLAGVTGDVQLVANSAGRAMEQFEKASAEVAFRFKQITQEVKRFFTEVGEAIMPTIKVISELFSALLKILGPFKSVIGQVLLLTAVLSAGTIVAAALIKPIIALKIAMLGQALAATTATAANYGWLTSLKLALAGGLGSAVTGAIAAVGAKFLWLGTILAGGAVKVTGLLAGIGVLVAAFPLAAIAIAGLAVAIVGLGAVVGIMAAKTAAANAILKKEGEEAMRLTGRMQQLRKEIEKLRGVRGKETSSISDSARQANRVALFKKRLEKEQANEKDLIRLENTATEGTLQGNVAGVLRAASIQKQNALKQDIADAGELRAAALSREKAAAGRNARSLVNIEANERIAALKAEASRIAGSEAEAIGIEREKAAGKLRSSKQKALGPLGFGGEDGKARRGIEENFNREMGALREVWAAEDAQTARKKKDILVRIQLETAKARLSAEAEGRERTLKLLKLEQTEELRAFDGTEAAKTAILEKHRAEQFAVNADWNKRDTEEAERTAKETATKAAQARRSQLQQRMGVIASMSQSARSLMPPEMREKWERRERQARLEKAFGGKVPPEVQKSADVIAEAMKKKAAHDAKTKGGQTQGITELHRQLQGAVMTPEFKLSKDALAASLRIELLLRDIRAQGKTPVVTE